MARDSQRRVLITVDEPQIGFITSVVAWSFWPALRAPAD